MCQALEDLPVKRKKKRTNKKTKKPKPTKQKISLKSDINFCTQSYSNLECDFSVCICNLNVYSKIWPTSSKFEYIGNIN